MDESAESDGLSITDHIVVGALDYQDGAAFDDIAVVVIKTPLPCET